MPGGSATLTASPCACGPPMSPGEAGAGEQRPPGLVQRDGQHPRVVPEDPLDAVAVVHVDVDVGDPLGAVVEQPLDADGDVVVDAEARGVARHRVVQPAAEVDAVLRASLPDVGAAPAGCPRPRARSPRACRGRPGRRRCRARMPGRPAPGRADAALHRGDVVGGVHRRQDVVARRRPARRPPRRRASNTPERVAQPGREVEADRVHGMTRPEVVGGEAGIPDHPHL